MSRTNRSTIRQPRRHPDLRLVDADFDEIPDTERSPVDPQLEEARARLTLETVVRWHRWQLVATARRHLRRSRADAQDIVQQVCVEALAGELAFSSDPAEALEDLRREVVRRCRQE